MPEDLKKAYTVFKESLIESHSGLYDYCAKDDLEQMFKLAEEKIKRPMISDEFYKTLMHIIHLIKDYHTTSFPNNFTINLWSSFMFAAILYSPVLSRIVNSSTPSKI